jgi:hypothetical protein
VIGYHKNCKICNSEQRARVEQMREDGASLQKIVDFMAEHGVTLSKPAVKRHFDTHFAPREEAAKRYYEQSEAVMRQAVEKRLSDLEMLDATIERNYRLHILASESIEESLTKEEPVVNMYGKVIKDPETGQPLMQKPGPSKPMVDLLSSTSSELRQAIKLKAELLGETETDELTIKVSLPGLDEDADD